MDIKQLILSNGEVIRLERIVEWVRTHVYGVNTMVKDMIYKATYPDDSEIVLYRSYNGEWVDKKEPRENGTPERRNELRILIEEYGL